MVGSSPTRPTMENQININEVRKQLLKSKVNAIFSHYVAGNLYYNVKLEDGIYQFPIPTIEEMTKDITNEGIIIKAFNLSSDLGTTSFYKEMKGSELNRWIGKAIENSEFIKIS